MFCIICSYCLSKVLRWMYDTTHFLWVCVFWTYACCVYLWIVSTHSTLWIFYLRLSSIDSEISMYMVAVLQVQVGVVTVHCPWSKSKTGEQHCVSSADFEGIHAHAATPKEWYHRHFSNVDEATCVANSLADIAKVQAKVCQTCNEQYYYPDLFGRRNCVYDPDYQDWMEGAVSCLYLRIFSRLYSLNYWHCIMAISYYYYDHNYHLFEFPSFGVAKVDFKAKHSPPGTDCHHGPPQPATHTHTHTHINSFGGTLLKPGCP